MKTAVVVGVFSKGSSNNGIVRALKQLGYVVKKVPYRDVANVVGVDGASWGVVSVAEVYKPDIMIFCKFNGFDPLIVAECSGLASKTCLWFMDSFNITIESPEIIEHARNASFSICWPGVADEFTKLGVENCYGLVEGCDETEFYPTKPVKEFKADISFIGTKNHRHEYVEVLKGAGFNVKCYGNGYDSYVAGDDFNKVCSSSKAVLNIPTHVGEREYFGDRIVRTLATKTLSITQYVPGLERYFEHGKNLVWFFSSPEECVEVVRDHLHNKEISKEGYKLFLEKYTCLDFVKQMLDIGGVS